MAIPIVSLDGAVTRQMHKDIALGDEQARREFTELFRDWEPPYECFLCGKEFSHHKPATLILPDPKHPTENIGVGTCLECYREPILTAWQRPERYSAPCTQDFD